MIKLNGATITDLGKLRDNNEDNYYVNGKYKENNTINSELYLDENPRKSYLYAVCDGMGGEALGEEASFIAVKTLANYQDSDFSKIAKEYIDKANKLICDKIENNSGVRIGTTLAILYISENDKVITYNIGDSRVYLFRKNELIQLSHDHTQAQRLVNMGLLKHENVKTHKDRNKLTQHLGIFPDELIIEPYVSKEIDVKQNDIFLLCSDGLTDMVSDEEIEQLLMEKDDAEGMAKKLIERALKNGGKDNVTVIVVKVVKQKGFWNTIF